MHDILIVLWVLIPETAESGGSYDQYADVGVKIGAGIREDVEG
jgi:hypothetical protein